MQGRMALLLTLLLLVTACGGGSSNSAGSSSASISGNWQMTLQKNKTKLKRTQSGFLQNNKDAVTGSVILTDIPCSGVGTVTGSVSGTNIALSVGLTGLIVNLTGTVGSDQASMSGDYTILSTGCEGSSNTQEAGTWTAALVKPLNGNFQGTFTSQRLGTALPVTGKVSQGPNAGISNAPLTGNLSVTGYCFTTANIVGLVSGTAVVMNLVNPDGVQIGQLAATSTADATSMIGTYDILPQGPGGKSPCENGDRGTVCLDSEAACKQ
jgi:hypothetical protein